MTAVEHLEPLLTEARDTWAALYYDLRMNGDATDSSGIAIARALGVIVPAKAPADLVALECLRRIRTLEAVAAQQIEMFADAYRKQGKK